MNPTNDNAEILRSALHAAKLPFCAMGDIPISQKEPIKLFFERPGQRSEGSLDAKGIIFPLASSGDIKPLLEACKQASFGRGGEEVLDPSYRRALVLHASSFAIAPASAIDPCGLGIISKIRQTLLSISPTDLDGDEKRGRRIIARLDKLNVYSTGDFFKSHVDTPRSTQMFGTLLMNLPVAHEEGGLVVYAPYDNNDDRDRSGAIAQSSDANLQQRDSYTTTWGAEDVLSWIAFFSDCPHEVLPVKSGNRVTLSYNLFFEDEDTSPMLAVDVVQERIVGRIVSALELPGNFDDSQPFVAFHLQHRYPVQLDEDQARAVEAYLKGRDALIYHALRAVNASITFHFVYPDDEYDGHGESDYVLEETSQVSFNCLEYALHHEFDGHTLHSLGVFTALEVPIIKYTTNGRERERLCNEPKFATATKFTYLAYGNEPEMVTQYASICMIASAPGHDIRANWPKKKSFGDGDSDYFE